MPPARPADARITGVVNWAATSSDPPDLDVAHCSTHLTLPDVKVVKSFVTQEQDTATNPKAISGGNHTMFLAGNDSDAKKTTTALLESYGWTDILDLGDLVTARGMEMYAHIHAAISMTLGIANHFGIKITRR